MEEPANPLYIGAHNALSLTSILTDFWGLPLILPFGFLSIWEGHKKKMTIMDKQLRFILKEMNKEFGRNSKRETDRTVALRNRILEQKEKDMGKELNNGILNKKEREISEEKIMGEGKMAKRKIKKRETLKRKPRTGSEDTLEIKRKEVLMRFTKRLNMVAREIERAFGPLVKMRPVKIDKREKIALQYGNHSYIKSIRKDTPEAFDYTIHRENKSVATVCLLRLSPNIYARGIAICGPADKNITASKGKDIAYRRAKFALRERLSTCGIRRKNELIKIVRKEFHTKYKAQYRVVLTEQEEKMIAQKDVRSMNITPLR